MRMKDARAIRNTLVSQVLDHEMTTELLELTEERRAKLEEELGHSKSRLLSARFWATDAGSWFMIGCWCEDGRRGFMLLCQAPYMELPVDVREKLRQWPHVMKAAFPGTEFRVSAGGDPKLWSEPPSVAAAALIGGRP